MTYLMTLQVVCKLFHQLTSKLLCLIALFEQKYKQNKTKERREGGGVRRDGQMRLTCNDCVVTGIIVIKVGCLPSSC